MRASSESAEKSFHSKLIYLPRILIVMAVALLPANGNGVPGEAFISRAWHVVHSASSPLVNPAFVIERDMTNIRYAGTNTLRTFDSHEFMLSIPLTFYQSMGVSWLYHGTSDYDHVDINESTLEQTTLGTISDKSHSFFLSYAANPLGRLTFGANVQIAYQRFAEKSETGIGLDAGVSYRLRSHPVFGHHVLGVALLNALAPHIGAGYARSLNLSWHGEIFQRHLSLGVDWRLKDLFRTVEEAADTTTAEELDTDWSLNTDLGLWMLKSLKAHGLLGFTANGIDHYGFAAGLNLPAANRGRTLEALFQVLWHEGGAMTYTWYTLADFGSHREERYARRKAQRLNTAPSLLYERALELFRKGQYWEAYFAYAKVRTEFPDFFKNDWVDFYSARCLEELHMNTAAKELYERTQAANPRSAILPRIDLGLMRVYYRQGLAGGVRKQFKRLRQMQAPDSLQSHALYLWGQSNMRIGQFSTARQALNTIPASHPEYLFAQYTAAIACMELGKPNEALGHLMNVSSTIPTEPSAEEIRHKSAVMIGYLLLDELKNETEALSKAVAALRSVPGSSMFYAEAQLGLGWAALHAQNWADCLDAGSQTMRTAEDPVLKAEGGLLVGYARFYLKNYKGAQNILEPISESLDELATIPRPPPHLSSETRQGFDQVATSMLFLSDKMQSPRVLSMIDSLQGEKNRFEEGIDTYRRHGDIFSRHQLLMKRFDDLRTDVDFLLAKAISFAATRKSVEIIEEAEERTLEIEQEIKALQQQIRSLKQTQ